MMFIKNRSLKIIVIGMLCIMPCALLPEKDQNVSGYLHNLLSLRSPLPGKLNAHIQPIPQKSANAQETKHANGTKTIDYFGNHGKNIARIEFDGRGNISWFINFYTDGTQSKTTYNLDRTQTISFFGIDGKNSSTIKIDKNGNTKSITNSNPDKTTIESIYNSDTSQTINLFDMHGTCSSRTEIDARGITTSTINFHSNNTQTKTVYNRDSSQTVSVYDTNNKSNAITEIDARGITTSTINFHNNGTQTKVLYNPDRSQTVSVFGINNKSNSITEINMYGKPTKSIYFNNDNTQTTTTYHTDRTQTIDHRDSQGKRISLTRIHANATKISATSKLIVAWHEAAHAISHTHNDTLSLINYITIKPQEIIGVNGQVIKTEGHVQASRKAQIQTSMEEIDNKIITAICGAIGEQLLMQDAMLQDAQEILHLLSQPPYTDDMLQARQDAKEILAINASHNSSSQLDQKIDAILVRLYKKAYQFIAKHTAEIKKIADVLIEKETLTSDETYKLLNLTQPLFI